MCCLIAQKCGCSRVVRFGMQKHSPGTGKCGWKEIPYLKYANIREIRFRYKNDAFIEVKGTCFLVKQEDAHRSEITLFEGKIEFNVPSTRQKTVMRPLQKLIYNSVDSQTQIDNIANISWENGRYNFKDVPLAQLIQIVSQMYHTDILLQGVRKDESSFSGSIHYNEPLDKVLNKICFSLNLNIRQTDDRIVLY